MENFFIGRQAIHDRKMRVFAYELLYRETDVNSAQVEDGDRASSLVILNALSDIGLERLVGKSKAFFNLTRSLLLEEAPIPLERSKVVLEILEDIEVDEAIINGVRTLSQDECSIAIDDFAFEEKWAPLYPYIDIIKIEVPLIDWETIEKTIVPLRQYNIKLLAEKVENIDQYSRLFKLGFDYFQGYFFSRPTMIKGKRLEDNRQVAIRLLASLNDPKTTHKELERLITQDSTLSYRILRHLNSAAMGMPRKVASIGQAIIYLGLRQIQSWANLIALSGIAAVPDELFNTALVRAHMCRLLLIESKQQHLETTGFMAGLLSNLDALMGETIEQVVSKLPLADDIHDALLKGEGPVGEALTCTLAYERNNWEEVCFNDFDESKISEIYLNASEEAFKEHAALFD
ncbi:MAG: HDOD domain-containing protein [Candidatus Sedimenticola sp. (ex Thyasira tokunagai)]